MIGEKEVGCKICNKTVGQIFIDHIQEHIDKLVETQEKDKSKRSAKAVK